VDGEFQSLNPLVEEKRTSDLEELCQAWVGEDDGRSCLMCVAFHRQRWKVSDPPPVLLSLWEDDAALLPPVRRLP
jgi:hypothetical protein